MQRMLVMNGQKITQNKNAQSEWVNKDVEKAGSLKPGIYNLSSAQKASKDKDYTGVILHTTEKIVYQQTGKKSIIEHQRADFNKVPKVGESNKIHYNEDGKAVVSAAVVAKKLSR